jgi:tetratricopeptide (TPR) repeat protein
MHLLIKIVSIAIFLIGIINFSALAADEETLAKQAEQEGKYREVLKHYVLALQTTSDGSSKDQELREKIIKLSQKIQPPPAVPEEVTKYEGRAEAAVRNAKTPEDYLDASKEYKKALLLAPWVASYYFNLGVMLEKAGNPNEAIKSLRLYLLAAPNAPDVRGVQKRIAGLEYEIEKQAKTKAQPTHQIPDISGVWSRTKDGKWLETIELRITGRTIERRNIRSIIMSEIPSYPLDTTSWSLVGSDIDFDGKSIKSPIPPPRYGNRIENWKMTIVNTDAIIEEWFYEGGEHGRRFRDGALRDYITSPEWYHVEWKRE